MTLEKALQGRVIPDEIRQNLALVDIPHLSFDGSIVIGQLVIHRELTVELSLIFSELLHKGFPIKKMVPVVSYDWDDERSMEDNNTSAFNYRTIMGTDRLSNHSYGRAIDINPVQNPYILKNGKVFPPGAIYDTSVPGTIDEGVADIFLKRGWVWGGNWDTPKDWQHMEKPLK